MAAKKTKQPDFEASLKELETLVETLEQGDLSLEQSLQHFERGVTLTRSCQQALSDAQQKVDVLMENGPGEVPTITPASLGNNDL